MTGKNEVDQCYILFAVDLAIAKGYMLTQGNSELKVYSLRSRVYMLLIKIGGFMRRRKRREAESSIEKPNDEVILEEVKHTNGCGSWHRELALYIFRMRKWVKVGVICNRCGAVAKYNKFKDGFR